MTSTVTIGHNTKEKEINSGYTPHNTYTSTPAPPAPQVPPVIPHPPSTPLPSSVKRERAPSTPAPPKQAPKRLRAQPEAGPSHQSATPPRRYPLRSRAPPGEWWKTNVKPSTPKPKTRKGKSKAAEQLKQEELFFFFLICL